MNWECALNSIKLNIFVLKEKDWNKGIFLNLKGKINNFFFLFLPISFLFSVWKLLPNDIVFKIKIDFNPAESYSKYRYYMLFIRPTFNKDMIQWDFASLVRETNIVW